MSTEDDKKADREAQGRRLKAARQKQGFDTAKRAAKFYRLSEHTYSQHENGTRGMGRMSKEYAEKFGVAEEWLMRGHNPPPWAVSEMDLPEEDRRGGAEHFLRPWRLFRQKTEMDLAGRLGVPTDMLGAWESGQHELSDKWLRRIANELDTTAGAILDVDPAKVPSELLELWVDFARQQSKVARRLQAIRTGTTG